MYTNNPSTHKHPKHTNLQGIIQHQQIWICKGSFSKLLPITTLHLSRSCRLPLQHQCKAQQASQYYKLQTHWTINWLDHVLAGLGRCLHLESAHPVCSRPCRWRCPMVGWRLWCHASKHLIHGKIQRVPAGLAPVKAVEALRRRSLELLTRAHRP